MPILQPDAMPRNPADASQARAEERDVPSSGSLPVTQAIADTSAAGGPVLPSRVWPCDRAELERVLTTMNLEYFTGQNERHAAMLVLSELVDVHGVPDVAKWLFSIAKMKGVEL